MGSSQSDLKLSYYGTAMHPIQGQVEAFSIKGTAGKFVMKTKLMSTKQHFLMIQKIGKLKNQKLLTYYGNTGESTPFFKADSRQQIESQMYWQLLNHDLQKQIQRVKQCKKDIQQSVLWQVIDSILQASKFLRKFDLYPQLSMKKIQFSASMEPKLYWADVLPSNMHRTYERFIHYGQFRHALYSPQQLLEITRIQRSAIDRQKSVLFNLGMIVLQAAGDIKLKSIYDYHHKTFSEVKKREAFTKIEQKYSGELCSLLKGILQFFPKDRSNYCKLESQVNCHFKREGITIKLDVESLQKTEKASINSSEGHQGKQIKAAISI